MNITGSKSKFYKLTMLLPLLGLAGMANDVDARSQYIFSSGAPSCGACHWVTPENGLEIEKRYDSETGELTKVGPYMFWTDTEGNTVTAIDKMIQYCQFKLHNQNASFTYDAAKFGYKCDLPAPEGSVVQPVEFVAGPVVKSDSIGEASKADAATDIWAVTCPVDTAQLTVSVRDDAPKNPALISIQIKKGEAASTISTDKSEAKPYSKVVSLAAGADIYEVLINKSDSAKSGVENYTAKFVCKDIDKKDLAITAIGKSQDQ